MCLCLYLIWVALSKGHRRRRFAATATKFKLCCFFPVTVSWWGFWGLSTTASMASKNTKVLPKSNSKQTHLGSINFEAEAYQTPSFSMAMIRCFRFLSLALDQSVSFSLYFSPNWVYLSDPLCSFSWWLVWLPRKCGKWKRNLGSCFYSMLC